MIKTSRSSSTNSSSSHVVAMKAIVTAAYVLAVANAQGGVSVDRACYEFRDAITVSYFKPDLEPGDWVALYHTNEIDDLDNLDPDPSSWEWLCDESEDEDDCGSTSGEFVFRNGSPGGGNQNGGWPLREGEYQVIISGGNRPYEALVVGDNFDIGGCGSGSGSGSTTEEDGDDDDDDDSGGTGGTDGTEDVGAEEDTASDEDSTGSDEGSTGGGGVIDDDELRATLAAVKQDIEAVLLRFPTLGAKFIRLAFHDCVGGCDGCVDMENPDNAGLFIPIDFLEDIVDRHEGGRLSRADIWMMAALVSSEVAENRVNFEFPFQWVGRLNCEDLFDGDCGEDFNGDDARCGPTRGPHRELCHATSGTTTILDFFEEEFGFDAQQVVAIMGAHTVGTMRRQNLGFDAPNGWDLSNERLDQGYFVELAGGPNGIPNFEMNMIDNGDLGDDIPDRPQWEANVGGNRIVMLNTDIALVRQLEEGENLNADGSATCDFLDNNNNRCPDAEETIDHVVRYSRSRQVFLQDYREALELMVANGYQMEDDCPRGRVCQLTLDR